MENTKRNKVIRLTKSPESVALLQEIIDDLESGEVVDFVMMARKNVPKNKQEEIGGAYIYKKYWFGDDSCLGVIGMLEFMKVEIYDYIINRQQ